MRLTGYLFLSLSCRFYGRFYLYVFLNSRAREEKERKEEREERRLMEETADRIPWAQRNRERKVGPRNPSVYSLFHCLQSLPSLPSLSLPLHWPLTRAPMKREEERGRDTFRKRYPKEEIPAMDAILPLYLTVSLL